MAIYLVEVTFTLQVEAESEAAAEQDTREDWAVDELRTNGLPADCAVRASAMTVASKRWGNCLPWGGDGERTVDQILAAAQTPKEK